MLKLKTATLIKKITNMVQPTIGLKATRLPMIEPPINRINIEGMNAARNAKTNVQAGKAFRIASKGILMPLT